MPTIKIPAREGSYKGKEREISSPGPSRLKAIPRRQHQSEGSPAPDPSQPHIPIACDDETPVAGPSRYRLVRPPSEHSAPEVEPNSFLVPPLRASRYAPSTFVDGMEDRHGWIKEVAGAQRGSRAMDGRKLGIQDLSSISFRDFLELDWRDPYCLLPMYASRLNFEKIPLSLRKTQTLSVWQDAEWSVKEGRKGESDVSGCRAVENSREVPEGKRGNSTNKSRTRKGPPPPLNLVKSTKYQKRMTRSMTRRMGAKGQSVVVEERSGTAGLKERGPSLPSSHAGSASPTLILYEKCTDDFYSLDPYLFYSLGIRTARELTQFFQSSDFGEIEEMIETVRVRHIRSFAIRHAHRTQPHITILGRSPPPPLPLAKMNILRLRHSNLRNFLGRLNSTFLPFPYSDYDFIWKDLQDVEDEIRKLLPQWYHLFNKYVGEYDELITWLRFQIPIDTSKMETLEEVTERLDFQMQWIAEKRESDVARATDTFCDWADAQYAGMCEMEKPGREVRSFKKSRWDTVEADSGVHLDVEIDDDREESAHLRKRRRL